MNAKVPFFSGVRDAEQYLILMQIKALLSASEGSSVSSHHTHSLIDPRLSVVCTEAPSLTHWSRCSCLLVFRNPAETKREQEPMWGVQTRKLKLQQLDLGQQHKG